MPLLDLIILALIQGITEFLPISSSGHLVLAHDVMHHNDLAQARLLDVFVHLGTLMSVFVYLRKDIAAIMCGVFKPNTSPLGKKMLGLIVLASLPVILFGFVLHLVSPVFLGSPLVVAITTIVFALVLWIADTKGSVDVKLENMSFKHALYVGLAQILALIPGTSRAGITITAARALGYDRKSAAKFSIFLGAIAIAGASVLGGYDLLMSSSYALGTDILLAFVLSFLSGWMAMALMISWIERANFTVFVVYRLALGGIILALIYAGHLQPI